MPERKLTGLQLIEDERFRQKDKGYDETDAQYSRQQLPYAAACYILLNQEGEDNYGQFRQWAISEWPWAAETFQTDDPPLRALAKAGALIAAELDRLQALTLEEDAEATELGN